MTEAFITIYPEACTICQPLYVNRWLIGGMFTSSVLGSLLLGVEGSGLMGYLFHKIIKPRGVSVENSAIAKRGRSEK